MCSHCKHVCCFSGCCQNTNSSAGLQSRLMLMTSSHRRTSSSRLNGKYTLYYIFYVLILILILLLWNSLVKYVFFSVLWDVDFIIMGCKQSYLQRMIMFLMFIFYCTATWQVWGGGVRAGETSSHRVASQVVSYFILLTSLIWSDLMFLNQINLI